MNYDNLPEGFSLYRTVDLNTTKLKLWINLALLPILAAFVVVPIWLRGEFIFVFAVWQPLATIAAMIAVILLHELVHGLSFRLFGGGKPTYGHKLPFYLYAACENRYITKRSYVVIALAPLVVITVVLAVVCALVPGSWFWVVYFALVINAVGSVGDIYISLLLTRMPKDVLVVDSGTAMQIYSQEESA